MSMPTRSLRRNALSVLVQFSLPAMLAMSVGHAATCNVNSALDDPTDASAKVSGVDPATWTNWGAGATGAISLRDCILAANLMTGATGVPTNPGMTINLDAIAGSTITLGDALPLIFNTTSVGVVSGAAVQIDGNGHRIFFVSGLPAIPGSGQPDPDDAQAIIVALYDLALKNGKAQGGSGHAGGLGAGGALFVNKNATVTLDHVDITTNSAQGGTGATGSNYFGGGGMGGNAGARGGGGLGGNGVSAGFSFGGGIGTDSGGGSGGGFGGTGIGQLSSAQGFAGPTFGGGVSATPDAGIGGGGYRYGKGGFGGGGGTNTSGSTPTSPGGFAGGGGAPGEGGGGAGGGFGGGGGAMGNYFSSYNSAGKTGATGAAGGFGAGGAGGMGGGSCFIGANGPTGPLPGGPGGAGGPGGVGGGIGAAGTDGSGCNPGSGGSNGSDGPGGGGGLGGGVFVRAGGTLFVEQTSGATGAISGNTVTAGAGGPPGATGPTGAGGNGAAAGSGLFLMSGTTTTFLVDTSQTISDNIADDSFASLPAGQGYTQGDGAGAAIAKNGTGTLVLAAGTTHTYSGPTTINTGTLQLDGFLTASPITINGGGMLSGTGGTSQSVTLNSSGIIAPGDSPGTLHGSSLIWNGDSGGNAQMNFQLGPTGSGDSDELDLNFGFNRGSTGAHKFHFTDGSGPPTPGTVYTLVRFTSTTFTLDASDFTFDYSGAFAGSFHGTFALTGNTPPPSAGITKAPTSGLPPNSLTFAVAALAPTISKAFGASSIPVNGATTLSFHLANPNASIALSGIGFGDNLPAGLVVAATPGATNTCGGTFAPAASDTSLTFSGGSLAGNASCDISVNVQGTTAGTKLNTTGTITATESGDGTTSNTASLDVASTAPTIAKAFSPTTIGPAGTSTLSFTIANSNAAALTGVAFNDTFPAGVVVAATPNATNTCGGTFTAAAAAVSVSLANGTVAASASCTLSVDVQPTSPGTKDNTSGAISSTESGTGAPSNTATLTVNVTPVRLQSFKVD